MTFRQVARGIVRTSNAIERDRRRRARLHFAAAKAEQRHAMLQASSNAAEAYEQLVTALTEGHQIAFERIDWAAAANAAELEPAVSSNVRRQAAVAAADAYSPGWIARTFGSAQRRHAALQDEIAHADEADKRAFAVRNAEVGAHNAAIAFARNVAAGDRPAMIEALKSSALSALPFAVEHANIKITKDDRIIAIVDGLSVEAMPAQSVTLLQSGKASVKVLPQSRINDLHRSNICSAAIRTALELLRTLPVPIVEIVMRAELLDPATGSIEPIPVVYLRVAAQALATLNLKRTESFALVDRLGGHLNWTARTGFRPLDTTSFDLPPDDTEE